MRPNIRIIKYLLLLVFSYLINPTFSQDTYHRQLKYWYLRDRLRYFIAKNNDPLNENGSNLVITARNRNESGGDGFENFADYGQESSMFGKYIGVLATEYYLLTYYGKMEEAAKTDQELMEALLAQMRRDLCEHNYGHSDVVDGFFIRHDVPPDQIINPFLAAHPELNTYAGLLISHDPLLDPGSNPQQVLQATMAGNATPYVEAANQDEAIFTLEGLALAYHFGSPTVQPIAQSFAQWILDHCWAGGSWQYLDPNGNVPVGGDCTWLSKGFTFVSLYFNGPVYTPIAYSIPYWYEVCYNGWGSSNTCHMAASLAAIGDGWGPGSATQSGIYNNCDGLNNWREYYLWLNEALQDYHHDYWPVSNVEDRLDEAPCEGPWRHNQGSCAPNGWASTDRWYHTVDEQSGTNGIVGIYSGIDYMILLNLYYICNVVGCSSCGVPYQNMDEAILSSHWPQGNEGSIYSPLILNTFRSISSTENILNIPIYGDVSYYAGKSITLNPGFSVDKNAVFVAQIQPMNYCPNGPFRNDSISKLDTLRHKFALFDPRETSLKDVSLNSSMNIFNESSSCTSKSTFYSNYYDQTSFAFFPNPVDGILFIEDRNHESFKFVLEDIKGTILMEKGFGSDYRHEVDLSTLKPGVYIVKLLSQNNSIVRRIVKE